MRTFFVVNPRSGNGRTGRRWLEINAKIAQALSGTAHAFTQRPMDAATLTARALKEGYQCIVAVGGDGTINEVVNGFFEDRKPLVPGACLGVIPQGTGGDFRRTFGWDLDLKAAVDRVAAEPTLPLDIGVLDYLTEAGKPGVRYFANVCSFGISGLVDREVNRSSKMLGGKVSFAIASIKAFLKYRDRPVRFSVDGGKPEMVSITTLSVANGRYFGGGMCVAPEAVPSDGFLDVTIWSGFGLSDFVLKSKALYSGSHTRLPGTRCLRCRTLEAESEQEVFLDADGEPVGKLPCKMSLISGAIQLKMGEAALPKRGQGRALAASSDYSQK